MSLRPETAATENVVWLRGIAAPDAGIVGGKGAGLARLCALGLPVPDGFVVTADAFRAVAEMDRARHVALSNPLREEIAAAYHRLGGGAVAVRSSGTAEDLDTASFAGQHDTFLDVDGEEALADAVTRCWASLFSARAVDYRRRRGWQDGDLAMAVVVQRMVPADWAGVLFTVDPLTGDSSQLVVEAVRGLGEALVSGATPGERWRIDRVAGAARGEGELPRPALAELHSIVRRVEEGFGGPQDIEWAWADGQIWLLQARPLTVVGSAIAEPRPGRLARSFAPTAIDHVPVTPLPFDTSLFFAPLFDRILSAARSVGVGLPPTECVLVEVADGVVQVVPPTPRPTPKLVRLPGALVHAFGAEMDAWLADADKRVVRRSLEVDREPLDGLADAELLARIRELQALLLEFSTTRFPPLARGAVVSAAFGQMLRATVGRDAATFERRLVTSLACTTTEANRAIDQLARSIRGSELRPLFESEEPGVLRDRLIETADGRLMAHTVAAYMRRFGLRETILPSAGFPAWRDDPDLVYGLLTGLVRAETRDHAEDDPERARDELVRRLAHGRGPRRFLLPWLLQLLDATRAFLAFREESHFRAFLPFPVVRRLSLELGRRLVERGAIRAREDVFYLGLGELEAGDEAGFDSIVRRRRTARRQARSLTIVPPELIETVSSGDALSGIPVSAGAATGPVRIIRSEANFSRLEPGDVLVAPYTNPTWTPLFAIAAAVVVDGGGAASHAAIVAREYGLPAVMGTLVGTGRLHDGELVLVDGSKGSVTRLGPKR